MNVPRQTPVFSIFTNSLIRNKGLKTFPNSYHLYNNLFSLGSGFSCLSPKGKVRPLLLTAPWYLSCQRKTQGSQAPERTTFYSHKEETEQVQPLWSLIVMVTPDSCKAIDLHTAISCHRMKDHVPSHHGKDIAR